MIYQAVLIFVALMGQRTSPHSEVIYGVWPFDTMVVVPLGQDSGSRQVYGRAVQFWQEQIPEIAFLIRDEYSSEERKHTLPFEAGEYTHDQAEECRGVYNLRRWTDRKGTFPVCLVGRFVTKDTIKIDSLKTFRLLSHGTVFIFDIFHSQDDYAKALLVAHEIGHALGLKDGPTKTIMYKSNERAFSLNDEQRVALRALYGGRKSGTVFKPGENP